MPPTPPARLEFTDCLGCGKRVATTATICRHCNTKRGVGSSATKVPGPRDVSRANSEDDDPESDSHAALSLGGYGKDDYDEEGNENESPPIGVFSKMQTIWWFVALMLLVFFVVSALLPLLR